ncbi:SGNH/GDSL hydrolase family protein [Ructibacterium gallinarum]|uniref:SGNH/GDSL hydrolase family protein n=1 Tax=Ructibacterium gallinarum TaxID=2779355 RepID=A0A9D5LYT8_9FIRM|nr:SGNH/GDSL hydrolase family protein [Ructibacterium gallinarum]MBE5040516.1 SGNH/GDSL hydrolase family protein [Ructibacterium gallinarum]
MDIKRFIAVPDEKPLDHIVEDGGFTKVFRSIACIGDSLSSGEFESNCSNGGTGYHDFFEYSWGQYIAREAGINVLNFSRGGMTAKEYDESFAAMNGFWSEDKLCQAYIMALGVNDLFGKNQEVGTVEDINIDNRFANKPTFAGYYAKIIQSMKTMQPKAMFFLMTMPRTEDEEKNKKKGEHAELLYRMADFFDHTYVIDLYQYAPVYDAEFRRNFYLGGHMNPAGYILTAKMVMSYIDYIVRHNPEDFAQVGFIGKPYYNAKVKW